MNTRIPILCLTLVLSALGSARTADAKAPETFRVKFDTTKGDVIIEVNRSWAPLGADRFHEAVKAGFYNNVAFFRVLEGFVAQFGINGDPKVQAKWRTKTIKDDPVKKSNKRGTITFATSGRDSRTTQLFINLADNGRLDELGFSPFARVVKGMDVVGKLYNGYGEGPPTGTGPSQARIQKNGNEYLKKLFPKLDYIKTATIVKAKKESK